MLNVSDLKEENAFLFNTPHLMRGTITMALYTKHTTCYSLLHVYLKNRNALIISLAEVKF